MRTLFLLTVFLCIGAFSNAQDKSRQKKILIQEKSFELTTPLNKPTLKSDNKLTGIYKFKHSKIKSALAFSTKRGRLKLA